MKERIELLIKTLGYTSSKFADKIGVQASNISHILSGRNKPSLDFIEKILTTFTNVNPDWLVLGIGDIYRCKLPESTPEKQSCDVTCVTNKSINSGYIGNDCDYKCNNTSLFDSIQSESADENHNEISGSVNSNILEQSQKILPNITTLPENKLENNKLMDSDEMIERIVIFYKNKTVVSYRP